MAVAARAVSGQRQLEAAVVEREAVLRAFDAVHLASYDAIARRVGVRNVEFSGFDVALNRFTFVSARARSLCIASFTIIARMPSTRAFMSSSIRRTSSCSTIGTRPASRTPKGRP